jgi:aryl carrier-like protein
MGLCLAAPLLMAQNQPIESERQNAEKRLETANELQKQLERVKAELASVKQKLRDSSAPEANAVISVKVEELQKRAELMGTDLDSIRMEMRAQAPSKPLSPDSLAGARFVQIQPRKGLSVELIKGNGEFTTGENSFCVDFRSIRDGRMADAGDVHTDFTQAIRRVRAVRAVPRLTQTDMGRYCGKVTLPTPGTWVVTANYAGPFGKGKALFAPTVK